MNRLTAPLICREFVVALRREWKGEAHAAPDGFFKCAETRVQTHVDFGLPLAWGEFEVSIDEFVRTVINPCAEEFARILPSVATFLTLEAPATFLTLEAPAGLEYTAAERYHDVAARFCAIKQIPLDGIAWRGRFDVLYEPVESATFARWNPPHSSVSTGW